LTIRQTADRTADIYKWKIQQGTFRVVPLIAEITLNVSRPVHISWLGIMY